MAFLSQDKLIGFKYIGKNVQISELAVFFNKQNISIGDNSRIDAFCIISANEVEIGKHVHIASHVTMTGHAKISIGDFSGISVKCSLFSSNDDYSGNFMSNPTVPIQYKNVVSGNIEIGRHVIIGCNSVILPKLRITDGVSIGAQSLVKKDILQIGIYVGNPCKFIKEKSTKMFELEKQLSQNS
jgi:galactoside O-acetyltransferase